MLNALAKGVGGVVGMVLTIAFLLLVLALTVGAMFAAVALVVWLSPSEMGLR